MAELWDVYDAKRNKTGRLHERGKPLQKGDYHLVVNVWLLDKNGRVLLTKRHPEKHWGGFWECTGGAVLAGENSLQGAIRETSEEIGLQLDAGSGILLQQQRRNNAFLDIWLFNSDVPAEALSLQPEEVVDAKWVDEDEYKLMKKEGKIVKTIPGFYTRYLRTTVDKNGEKRLCITKGQRWDLP